MQHTNEPSSIITGQLAALEKKLKAGKPLNGVEMTFLEKHSKPAADAQASVPDNGADVIATNANDLAKRLGVHRQTIAHHQSRAEAPKDFSVKAWREYLLTHGKLPTWSKVGGSKGAAGKASAAKAEQILLQNEKLRDNILKGRGELIPRVLAKQVLGKLLLSVKSRTFASVSRFVMLARMAPDTMTGAAEIHKELTAIWQAHEDSKWLKHSPAAPAKAPESKNTATN
jgi:hypothetical protein